MLKQANKELLLKLLFILCLCSYKKYARSLYLKNCNYCGIEFKTPYNRNQYCSRKCSGKAAPHPLKFKREIRTCIKCQKGFEISRERLHRYNQGKDKLEYCSKSCAYQDSNRWAKIKGVLNKGNRKIYPSCRIAFQYCKKCGKLFSKHKGHLFCGDECKKNYISDPVRKREIYLINRTKICTNAKNKYWEKRSIYSKIEICKYCGKEFTHKIVKKDHSKDYCSFRCSKKMRKFNERYSSTFYYKSFSPIDIFKRDGWICHLCGKKVNKKLLIPHPLSPSVDHIIPISKGGQHIISNVSCAHLNCNARKSNRVFKNGEQLRLI